MKKEHRAIVDKATEGGSWFFHPDTMKAFDSRLVGPTATVGEETWFITSDKFSETRRTYTIRRQKADGHVQTLTRSIDGSLHTLSAFPTIEAATRTLTLEAQVARITMANTTKVKTNG